LSTEPVRPTARERCDGAHHDTPARPRRRAIALAALTARLAALAAVATPAVLATLATGCIHRTSTEMTGVCKGMNVTRDLVLAIDSLSPAAGRALARFQGQRFTIRVNLFNPVEMAECQDRSGEAYATVDHLPDELERAAAGARHARWRVDGPNVVVELNPQVRDNNLTLVLPLSGQTGRWTMSSIAGTVASGRLEPEER
jgi:hypothetical protein